LYEALKKDVSEESARMVAEALAQSGDAATKDDIASLQAGFARLEAATKTDISRLESKVVNLESSLKSYIDSRLLRYTAIILVPVALTMLGSVGALIALVVNLK